MSEKDPHTTALQSCPVCRLAQCNHPVVVCSCYCNGSSIYRLDFLCARFYCYQKCEHFLLNAVRYYLLLCVCCPSHPNCPSGTQAPQPSPKGPSKKEPLTQGQTQVHRHRGPTSCWQRFSLDVAHRYCDSSSQSRRMDF